MAQNDAKSTYSEAWRRECEARAVLKMPRADRIAFYGRVRERRGEAAATRLIEDVKAEYRKTLDAPQHEPD